MVYRKFYKNESIFREQAELCIAFSKELQKLLADDYETFGTTFHGLRRPIVENKDTNKFCLNDYYLVPLGTKKEITYYSKPKWSFRFSDHWNWYEKSNRCDDTDFIQCFNVDLPRVGKRFVSEDKRSAPCTAIQVAIFTHDHVKKHHDGEAYHCVYGSYKNKDTHSWEWMEKTPQQVIEEYCLA